MNNYSSLLGMLLLCLFCSVAVADQNCPSSIVSNTPDSRYTNNGDGTVTDKHTGLTWMRCSLGFTDNDCTTGAATGYSEWSDALNAAEAHSFAGQTDWRLPNRNELASLVNRACVNPAINTTLFPSTVTSNVYWSSSPFLVSSDKFAWGMEFAGGKSIHSYLIGVDYKTVYGVDPNVYVRLVRAGGS